MCNYHYIYIYIYSNNFFLYRSSEFYDNTNSDSDDEANKKENVREIDLQPTCYLPFYLMDPYFNVWTFHV